MNPQVGSAKIVVEPLNIYYTYVVVRKDIPHVYQIIQAAHAVQEQALKFPTPTGGTNHMVLLKAKDADQLMTHTVSVRDKDINMLLFYEPDYDTGFTAAASEPLHKDDPRRAAFRALEMYR